MVGLTSYRANTLIRQGRLLAEGKEVNITSEKWLQEYEEIRDDLKKVQQDFLDNLREQIQTVRHP